MAQKDYYQILGLSKNATAAEIKSAYRKLALEFHPDRNKSKDADAKFKEVTKAYEVLSDENKRKTYDQVGHSGFEQGGFGSAAGGNPFSGGGPFGGQQSGQYGPFTYSTSGGSAGFDFGGGIDPFEIFEQFFGGQAARQRRPSYSIKISFDEAVHGTEKQVSIDGKSQKIKIPSGVDRGSRIRFGDYDVVIDVSPSSKFAREGYNIVTDKEISFPQAALGGELKIETVDGEVKIRIPNGTQPETVIRLAGRGVKHVQGSGKGDHYVRIKVTIPKKLTREQKDLLEKLEKVN
ncbi:MAG TPA: DnaJ C-terminal domain-containing protein [Candidatus Saccharimonadales bacterium]|nr:DnaJ C-terminal domain-containing protein [Candidatus Saccharimonadales bacterium]